MMLARHAHTFRRSLPVGKTARSVSLSATQGPLDPPLLGGTLTDYWQRTVQARHAERQALICRSEPPRPFGGPSSPNFGVSRHLVWDFAEFERHIAALARGLVSLGVKQGDRVAIVMGNHSAYACLQWACARVGAILVTINPAYRTHEMVNAFKLVDVSHVFLVPHIRTSAYLEGLSSAVPGILHSAQGNISDETLPALRNLVVVDNSNQSGVEYSKDVAHVKSAIDFRDIFVWDEHASEQSKVQAMLDSQHQDDTINMQWTSGTTGSPKAVCLTHHGILNNAIFMGQRMDLSTKDVVCNVPPLFHCFGLVLGNLASWLHGASVVYASESFDPKPIVDAITEDGCTTIHGVQTHFLAVLAEVDRRLRDGEHVDTRSLRTGIAAGSVVPHELMKRLIEKLNLTELCIAYGMTETSPTSFQSVTTDPYEKRVQTVGRAMPHTRAKLVDRQGKIVPVGERGEILLAGYLLQKGYWQNEEQTRKAIRPDEEGTLWMHTGDEGILDEQGYLRISGRIKDIIIRGGENLFPVNIENVMMSHPGVMEVAAVAVPDPTFGEVVGLWISRQPGTAASREEIRAHVGASMNPQNTPAWVWFVGEDMAELSKEGLPKTASGKVQKHVLRDWSARLAEKGVGKISV